MRKRKDGGKVKDGRSTYHISSVSISSVSRRYNIHPQTLRLYEREGLLRPSRSEGNTRLYTDEDLKQLELILNLVRDLGVNLAGVEVVLHMRQRMERMEAQVNELLVFVKKEFFSGREDEFESRRGGLVPLTQTKIVKVE